MPKNLGFESLPLEEEPPCFFDANRTEINENTLVRVLDPVEGRPVVREEVGDVRGGQNTIRDRVRFDP